MSRIFREGYVFDFFQSMWLLEHAFPGSAAPGEATRGSAERIRIRPHSGLGFPASDVREVAWLDEDQSRAQVTVTFMGLYGVASPLPVYFYDAIGIGQDDAKPLRDFLDIFNHRLYSFFYQAWKKYRPTLHGESSMWDRHARIFTCLGGMGTAGFTRPTRLAPLRLVSFAGLLSSGARNAIGLEILISTILDGIQVRVLENVLRWVEIRERPRMGDGAMMLGQTALLGQRVSDASGKFRVVLGPLNLDRFRMLLPEGEQADLLKYLVRLYASDYLDYDVELLLRTSEVPLTTLGGTQKLGVDTWLGRPPGEVVSAIVQYS